MTRVIHQGVSSSGFAAPGPKSQQFAVIGGGPGQHDNLCHLSLGKEIPPKVFCLLHVFFLLFESLHTVD